MEPKVVKDAKDFLSVVSVKMYSTSADGTKNARLIKLIEIDVNIADFKSV